MRFFKNLYNRYFRKKSAFYNYLVQILGFYPENLSFYELAFQHKSTSKQNNERLEFLGDSILDAVISEALYFRFPEKDEGELSKLRSKLVSRTFLNEIGQKLKLETYLKYQLNSISIAETNLLGNVFESLIGAIYLDGGYALSVKFLETEILEKHVIWDEMDTKIVDFKSKMMQFSQKSGKKVEFHTLEEILTKENIRMFTVEILVDDQALALGSGSSKKKAEQQASELALEILSL